MARWALLLGGALAGDLSLLPPESPGRCMDGSPGGFYFEAASGAAGAGKWVLWLEGGGECTTEEACRQKAATDLGSSKGFRKWRRLPHLASADPHENPLMAAWNRAFLRYCSQDLWSGTRTGAGNGTWGLLFSGHLVFKEVLAALQEHHGLGEAKEVVLGGESAGGIGTWLNAGYLRDMLPKARVVAAPLAGFYGFAQPYTGPGARPGGLADFREGAWPGHVALWQARVDPDCAAGLGARAYACMLANYSRPFLRLQAFVTEALTDQIQLEAHDDLPARPWSREQAGYVRQWQRNMSYGLRSLPAGDGFFAPACYTHTGFAGSAPLIEDGKGGLVAYSRAFASWYGGESVRLEDSCGMLCGRCATVLYI